MSATTPENIEVSLLQAIEELQRRHALGEAKICESVLVVFPQLCGQRDAVLELIYLEYVLCQEADRPIPLDELQIRFPEYQADLQKVLSVDKVFRNQDSTPAPADSTIDKDLNDGRTERLAPRGSFDHLGDYELLEIIGHGGMGVVYRARQRRLNRLVAVKTIDMLSSLNAAAVARFRNEAELIAKLQHPNIVQIYEIGSKLGVPFFSMELVSGGTLAQATQERPLLPATAAKIVETLARAVHYAHSQSVVHRDLKPANILLSPSDRSHAIEVPSISQRAMLDGTEATTRCEPKIADFGLAKFLAGAIDRTATQAMIGTPSYMAPEQIDSELGTVGPACDIYSLGAILYDAMTGTPPFNAATVIETIQQVRTSDVVSPSKLQSKIPRDLETICLKCLLKEPTKRYQTASDLADDLQRFLSGQPILARPAGLVERNWKWARRHPSLTALFATAGVGFVTLAYASTLVSSKNRELTEGNAKLSLALADLEKANADLEKANELASKTLQSVFDNVTASRLAAQSELSENDRNFLNTSLQQYLQFADLQHDSEKNKGIRAQAYLKSGLIHWKLSQAPQAMQHLEKAVDMYEELLSEYNNPSYQDCLSQACCALIPLQMNGSLFEKSILTAKRGLAYFESTGSDTKLIPSKESTSLRQSQADLLNALAGAYEAAGQLKESIRAFEDSRLLLEDLMIADPDDQAIKKTLASCYRSLGDLLGNSSATNEETGRDVLYADRAIALLQELADGDPADSSYFYGLSWAYYDRARVRERKGELGQAIDDVGKAITIIESLRKQYPLIEDYYVAFLAMHLRRARLAVKANRLLDAAEDIRCLEPGMVKSAEDMAFCVYALQKLNKAFPKQLEHEIFLIDMLRQQAAWYEARKNYQAAENDYKDAFVWCEYILERLEENPIAETRMVLCLLELSRVHALQGDTEKSKSEYDLARSKASSIKQLAAAEKELLASAFEKHDK